ncbi:glycerophosphodiester phosphodiesterase [Alicyclobacillus macrosporangiidus]|uniref:glycerophosphodiester phosphodiesterase n=1 Tax=Alicyclobacillus macrosporangiidus TaxID=392015 RepID=UPI000496F997|nr:glycerophosphodiester phosphodiesterase family protein [Alicyclobacillus macrosporangiidus]
MWVVAHRGGAELYPENSMTAFTKLAEMGVDLVECDVHLSRDGELVVIHDDNLVRTAGLDKPVNELTLAELRQIDIGDGQGVPSLADVIDAISIPVAVELKTPQTVEALARLLAGRPALIERIVPLSFFHDILLHLTQSFPGLQCGALLAGYPVDPVAVARSAGCTMLSLHFEGVTKAYVDRCHQGGILVSVWTPNREEDIRRMVEAGVDAIGSDRPDLVLKLVGRHSG